MKKGLVLLLALLLFASFATPAFAQGPSRGDSACFGGTATVRPDDSPDDLVLFGCGARVMSGGRVQRDIVGFGSNVVLEEGTTVGRDIVVFGANLDVGGKVGRRIFVFGGTLTLESGAVVGDDIALFGGTLNRMPGAVINGRVTQGGVFNFGTQRAPFVFPFITPWSPFWTSGYSFWSGVLEGFIRGLITTLGLAALGVLILVFLPAQSTLVSTTTEQAALPSLGVGCLTLFVGALLTLLLIVTCLGIPLALILIVLLAAAIVFGWVAVSTVLGEKLLRGLKAASILPIAAMLIGVFVLWLITQVPVLGGLISLFVASLGIGAVVLTRFGTQKYQSAAVAVAPVPPAPPIPPSPPVPLAAPTPPATPAPPSPSTPSAPGQEDVSI